MLVESTGIEGLLLIKPNYFKDERGFFVETYQEERYNKVGILDKFIQDNQSRSSKGVLRGLHFQVNKPQAQILTVMRGKIFDVAVDLRLNSMTFGKWFGVELAENDTSQIYMAPGFAHGFFVLSEWADLHYKVSCKYNPNDEGGLIYNDPEIEICWPEKKPLISKKDLKYPNLKDIERNLLPQVS